jgi:hypothetical protein
MKLLFENWRQYLAEADMPEDKYEVTMPLKDIYKIFMDTISNNIKELQKVADDNKKLAKKLTDIFKPEELNVVWEASTDRFDDVGDGAILHGKVQPEEGVDYEKEDSPLPKVTIITNVWTGKVIQNWDNNINLPAGGYTSARKVTGKELMSYSVRNTIVHEFTHQAQAKAGIMGRSNIGPADYEKLAIASGVDIDKMSDLMNPVIEVMTGKDYLQTGNIDKLPNDTVKKNFEEVRKLINSVYYGNNQEFPGWAQGVPSELIDMAHRGLLYEEYGISSDMRGEELKDKFIEEGGVFDQLEKDADKGYDGLPEIIKDETIALPYYSHTERGFAADFGIAGYKKFLEIARGYAEQYGESMY